MRKQGIIILGFDLHLSLIAGVVPAECVILSLLIAEMALRDWSGIDVVERAWEEVMSW
jgi:hypothetical protein